MAVFIPKKRVYGSRELKPLRGFPEGKVRLRMRNDDFLLARVMTSDGIREFSVVEEDGCWVPGDEVGANRRLNAQGEARADNATSPHDQTL